LKALQLDLQAILLGVSLPAFWWVLAVVVVTVSGYPGVICVTPLGWTLALSVGTRTAGASSSPQRSQRILEAALAGAGLGLLQGLLFAGVLALAGPDRLAPGSALDAIGSAALALLFVGAAGMLVCAALSAVMAGVMRRQE
jgi:hypothetical protein